MSRATGVFLAALLICGYFSPAAGAIRALPTELELIKGQSQTIAFALPITVSEKAQTALIGLDESAGGLSITARETGQTNLDLSLVGIIPIASVKVTARAGKTLIPGGGAIGIAMNMSGALVVGLSDLSSSGKGPAGSAGIKAGDYIVSVDGSEIISAEHLTRLIRSSGGRTLDFVVKRSGKDLPIKVTPTLSDGEYRLGAWVRDSTAGIGTLSFYDPETGMFAALGHAVTDVDTGELLSLRKGSALHAEITGVKKGEIGTPGELRGSFLREMRVFGEILGNSIFGIYGQSDENISSPLYPNGLPAALQGEITTGKASILSCLDGKNIEEFEIEITKLYRQSSPKQKSMVIKVTDERLLNKTGGIVQGMSGSPIIQSGKLVGAVTHVFVGDPTQGYGLYVEWMLDKADKVDSEAKAA